MRILSLFDGMSCGQIALNRLGLKDYTYYASEVDKYAIQITQKNFPNTIQVGDVTELKSSNFKNIDLLMAGSPCQGFSFAGKQLNFNDPRSALFFEFLRLFKEIKPKYFLLENVRMKKEWLTVISESCGVEPYLFNSAKVSAQNRLRYYWTNIEVNKYIDDKGIFLKDILENDINSKYNLSEAKKDRVLNAKRGKGFFYNKDSKKIGTIVAGYYKEPTDGAYIEYHKPVKQTERNRKHLKQHDEKSLAMTSTMYKGAGSNGMTLVPMGGGNREPKVVVSRKRHEIIKKNLGDRINDDTLLIGSSQKNAYLGKDKSSSLTEAMGKGGGHVPMVRGGSSKEYLTSVEKKTMALNDQNYWRKITPLEAERLQTVPDNYTEGVSNTQRYKMLGNGWTVDIIAHILKPLFK